MTGTEAQTSTTDEETAAWRHEHFSLSRLFFSFYLVAMGSFVVIVFIADFIISNAQRGITDEYSRRFMRGTILLIEEDLLRRPSHTWDYHLKALNEKFSYRLEVVNRDKLKLEKNQAQKLDQGSIAIDHKGEMFYHRIEGTQKVLVVGPLTARNTGEMAEGGMPLELRLQLLSWSLIGLIFAVALWFWLRPIWRDLESLSQTARALGDGDFSARTPAETRSKLFAPLALTLNGMADRIQKLIANQRELTSSISHELRTPIARLRFALEMLPESHDPDERQRMLAMMEQDLVELDQLIDASLTYARLEREETAQVFTSTALAEWLEDQVDALRPLGRNLNIETDTRALPPDCKADIIRTMLPYALKNLLRNAFKYSQSQVIIRCETLNERACIHVEDDGIGIPESERERVFQAFTRLDRSRDRTTGGHGLGLAIVRRVLDMHGGTARVENSALGGARFTICWPINHDKPSPDCPEKTRRSEKN